MAASRPGSPVSRMRVVSGYSCLTCLSSVAPSIPGMRISETMTAGPPFFFGDLRGAFPAVGGEHLVVAAQMHRQAVHDSGLIVNTENAGEFFAVHDCAVVLKFKLAEARWTRELVP